MSYKWREKRLEIIVLGIFFILLLTSLLFLYNSYTNYSLFISTEQLDKAFVHQVIMFISGTVLLLSLLIVYSKRDYFFVEEKRDTPALKNLFEEIKFSTDERKIEKFKEMLKEENQTEIYELISNMITCLVQKTYSQGSA